MAKLRQHFEFNFTILNTKPYPKYIGALIPVMGRCLLLPCCQFSGGRFHVLTKNSQLPAQDYLV